MLIKIICETTQKYHKSKTLLNKLKFLLEQCYFNQTKSNYEIIIIALGKTTRKTTELNYLIQIKLINFFVKWYL